MNRLLSLSLVMIFILSSCRGQQTTTPTPSTKVATTKVPTPSEETTTSDATVVNPPGCTDSAAFGSDVTIPDNTNLKQGEAFHKVWRVENTGTCTWTSDYTMVFYDGDQMGAPGTVKLNLTKPGETLDIAADMTAPDRAGIYRADFQMRNPAGNIMKIDQNTLLWVIINVGAAATSSSGTGSPSGGTGSDSGTSANTDSGLLVSNCPFTIDQVRANAVATAINAYRAKNGIPPYTVNGDLVTAAQSHAADMACNNLFGHTGSDGSTSSSRVASTGYAVSYVSENVYGSYPPLTASDVVTWWATDQTDLRHNQNLLSTQYTEIGVGYAFYNNYGYYVVDFATP